MRGRRISVDRANIAVGVPGDSRKCMIADAIREKYPWALWVMADKQSIRFSDGVKRVRYQYFTPPVAQKALLDFDEGKRIRPFSFTLSEALVKPMRKVYRQNNPQPSSKYKRNPKRHGTYMPVYTRKFGFRQLVKA